MASKYTRGKRGGQGRFVQLPEWLLASQAWRSLKPGGPRALYIELKRQYRGGNNNGKLFLSHRNAAIALGVSRNTVGGYYRALKEKGGFIVETRGGHCLGPSGVGESASYALTENPLDGAIATKDFMSWKPSQMKKPPRTIPGHSLAKKNRTKPAKNPFV